MMQARNWRVGLLACGILLLPLISVQAQDSEKKEGRGVIILQLDGKSGLILIKDRSPDQEAIELLQRALKILTKKSQSQPAGKPAKADEIKKLRVQLETLRREKDLLEARIRKAQARLAELQGKPGNVIPLQIQFKLQPDPNPKKGKVVFPQELQLQIDGGKITGLIRKKDTPPQLDELRSRLDRLLREAEELRRDIQRAYPKK
jgi:hypothetical protein